eukprot:CAMPEP_0113600958 /NCGR_PEP_ID=MMETSP0015_2-20120614/42976_1 /TAXON_ID=2838 /ORGANISM="Odontella" /LENGTH=229 /DNA_ID=CAMNT_0000509233 /DNA_START=168 /DNA_END=857 /DNA_ORIENTATION=+ /assembly_acc=CAM_ASM_000160
MNLVASLILSLVASSARSFSLSSASFVNPNKPLSAVRQSTALSLSNNDQVGVDFSGAIENCKKAAAACLLGIAVLTTVSPALAPSQVAVAAESRLIGEIAGSGLVFKDTLNVESFDDPKVKGVTLYISSFQRPLNERIQKDFFSDPGFASVGCAKTGPVQIADNIAIGKGGEEVFEESKSLLFKTLRVQRIYDKEKKTVVYISFNTRLDKNSDTNKSRFKSSTCAVNLD